MNTINFIEKLHPILMDYKPFYWQYDEDNFCKILIKVEDAQKFAEEISKTGLKIKRNLSKSDYDAIFFEISND